MTLISTIFSPFFEHPTKFGLISFNRFSSNIAKFSVFSNFVWRSGAARTSIDIYNRFLSHIQPNNGSIFRPFFATSLLNGGSKSINGGLTATVNFVAGHASEIRNSFDFVFEFLDFIKVVLHGHSLPYFWIIWHFGAVL